MRLVLLVSMCLLMLSVELKNSKATYNMQIFASYKLYKVFSVRQKHKSSLLVSLFNSCRSKSQAIDSRMTRKPGIKYAINGQRCISNQWENHQTKDVIGLSKSQKISLSMQTMLVTRTKYSAGGGSFCSVIHESVLFCLITSTAILLSRLLSITKRSGYLKIYHRSLY